MSGGRAAVALRRGASPRLYVVVDDDVVAAHGDWPARLASLLHVAGERAWVQVRCKRMGGRKVVDVARQVLAICAPFAVPVLINDRLDIAWEVGAHGVHLTEMSMTVAQAKALDASIIVAASRHAASSARAAAADGAALVVLGPVFATPSKQVYGPPLGLDVLTQTARAWPATCALAAIGGIATPADIARVRSAGATCVAAISALWSADGAAFAAAAVAGDVGGAGGGGRSAGADGET